MFFSLPYLLYLGTTWGEILLLLWLSSLTLKSYLCQVTAIYPPAVFVYSPEVANPSSTSSYLQINTIGVYKKSQQAYRQGCLHSVFDHCERRGGGVHNKTGPPRVARLYIIFFVGFCNGILNNKKYANRFTWFIEWIVKNIL